MADIKQDLAYYGERALLVVVGVLCLVGLFWNAAMGWFTGGLTRRQEDTLKIKREEVAKRVPPLPPLPDHRAAFRKLLRPEVYTTPPPLLPGRIMGPLLVEIQARETEVPILTTRESETSTPPKPQKTPPVISQTPEGPVTPLVIIRKKVKASLGAPADFRVVSVSRGRVELAWKPPERKHMHLVGYRLYRRLGFERRFGQPFLELLDPMEAARRKQLAKAAPAGTPKPGTPKPGTPKPGTPRPGTPRPGTPARKSPPMAGAGVAQTNDAGEFVCVDSTAPRGSTCVYTVEAVGLLASDTGVGIYKGPPITPPALGSRRGGDGRKYWFSKRTPLREAEVPADVLFKFTSVNMRMAQMEVSTWSKERGQIVRHKKRFFSVNDRIKGRIDPI